MRWVPAVVCGSGWVHGCQWGSGWQNRLAQQWTWGQCWQVPGRPGLVHQARPWVPTCVQTLGWQSHWTAAQSAQKTGMVSKTLSHIRAMNNAEYGIQTSIKILRTQTTKIILLSRHNIQIAHTVMEDLRLKSSSSCEKCEKLCLCVIKGDDGPCARKLTVSRRVQSTKRSTVAWAVAEVASPATPLAMTGLLIIPAKPLLPVHTKYWVKRHKIGRSLEMQYN